MAKGEHMPTYEVNCLSTAAQREAVPSFSFDLFLYLQPLHVALQAGPNWQMFVLVNTQTGLADGIAHFFLDATTGFSPWRAPFGGIQLNPQTSEEVASYFLHFFHRHLRESGVTRVQWLQCPDVYSRGVNKFLREVLPSMGYALHHDQRNHHITVTDTPFPDQAHSSLKRRLAKCVGAGFTYQQERVHALPEAYAFLKRCREEKQKPLSLSLAQLNRYFEFFPEQYFLFTVRIEQELAAVGVAVKISECILNHLYPASPQKYNAYSPTVLLNAGLYQFCQQQQITIFDVGVSAPVEESEDEYTGLFTFKSRLGGVESWKPTFVLGE